MAYIVTFIHEEDGVFGASFPDFPGATTAATDIDTLYRNATEALTLYIEDMAEDGEEIPEPRSLSDLLRDPKIRERSVGAILGLVEVDLPTKAVRINVSIEEGLLKRVDRAAAAHGESRSAFLASAVRKRLLADA